MRSLFEKRPEYPLSLQQIIFDISRLEVEPNDGLPQKACTWCATTLFKMHKSVETFRANDVKLRQQLVGTLQVEIKQEEEEVDVEMLEKAFTQELEIEGIQVKEEAMEEEYLDQDVESEQNDDNVVVAAKHDSKSVPSKRNMVDSENEDDTVEDANDDEWKPSEHDTEPEQKVPAKKTRRRTKQQRGADGKPKLGRRRKRAEDPNRPRLHDYKCYICKSDSHGTSEALIAHLNSSHAELVPYTCPDCVMETIVIKGVQGLNAHMRQHLNPEKCPYCDKRYTSKNNVALHVQMHHLEGNVACPSTCEYCGEVYPSKVSLLHHMKLHTTAVSCELCGKIFKERHKLRLHIQRRHEKLRKYECHFCKKKLVSLDSVHTHIKTYHSNQVFKCSYCAKTFASELTHRYHEKKHIENPNYVASKDWKEYYTVIEGEENSPGTKLKKCNLCGAICKAMGVHLSMIHFPTEFRCQICDMTFKRKQVYDIHVLEHEYGKAHHCPICGREFSDRKNLYAHLRTKKHQDHPLAKAVIGNLKPRKSKEESFETEEQAQTEVEVGTDNFM